MTRADEVLRLATPICATAHHRTGGEPCGFCLDAANAQYDAGARMPAPPAPRNPVSRETAVTGILAYWRALGYQMSGAYAIQDSMAENWRTGLLAAAPSLVADLAEAAKDRDGFVVVYQRRERIRIDPAALVAALTRADAGGPA